jgi:hypothetical protein
MHTYALVTGRNEWVDSRSQSITLNSAVLFNDSSTDYYYGQDVTQNCRINGIGGPVGCSVPHTYRVAFWGPHVIPHGEDFVNILHHVSWRDDRGLAHHYDFYYPCCDLESPAWIT